MNRFFQNLFSDKSVVTVNLFLFVICTLFGILYYARNLHGGSDDMSNLAVVAGSGSSLEYVKWAYYSWGQTGIVILIAVIQIAIKLFHVTPEGFPWWFFVSINMFCYLAAAYMLVMAGKRLLRYGWLESLFLLSFIYGVWLNPSVYKTTISMMPVTLFVAYELPTYLFSIALYLFSGSNFGQSKKDWLVIGCIYLVVSINTYTFLLSLPVLFTGIIFVRAIQENYSLIKIIRNIGFFAAISLASAIFDWTQPGFHARPISTEFAFPSFLEFSLWYTRSLEDFGFSILLENHYDLTHLVRYLPPFLLIVTVFGLWLWRKKDIQMNFYPQIMLLLSKSTWALILILGFLLCMLPLLFTSYFPYYTSVYPTLLMAGTLGLCVSFFINLFKPSTFVEILMIVFNKTTLEEKNAVDLDNWFPVFSVTVTAKEFSPKQILNSGGTSIVNSVDRGFLLGTRKFSAELYYSYWSWLKWFVSASVLAFVFYFNTIHNISGIYKVYQVEVISSALRQDFQQKMDVAYKAGHKNYIVTGCPKEIPVEQFWGITGYLYWKGFDGAFGVLDTDGNIIGTTPQEVWPDKHPWHKIDCLQLTSEQLKYLEP